MINWRKKLSSRKFWVAASALAGALMVAFGAEEATVSHVTAVLSAASVAVAYILAEARVDAAAVKPAGNREED